MNFYTIILAGGSSKRLQPISNIENPKQFIPIFKYNGLNMLQKTINRFRPISKKIIISSSYRYANKVKCFASNKDLIIIEQDHIGTAAAITACAIEIQKISSNAYIIVTPVDHHIENINEIYSSLSEQVLDKIGLVLSIPSHFEKEYGYASLDQSGNKIIKFIEKPNNVNNSTLWNTGIFYCRVKCFLKEMQSINNTIVRDCMDCLKNSTKQDNILIMNKYRGKKISIDYSFMQKSNSLIPKIPKTKWYDLGTTTNFLKVQKID